MGVGWIYLCEGKGDRFLGGGRWGKGKDSLGQVKSKVDLIKSRVWDEGKGHSSSQRELA